RARRGHAAEAPCDQGQHPRQGHGAQGAQAGRKACRESPREEGDQVAAEEAAPEEEVAMDKTALVTGATSGFGRATVERFVAAGWRVVACGRRRERLQALVDALGADRVHAAAFDIRDELS